MEPAALPAVLERLAIFPLPAVPLFPRTLLPLHVFEPRYRELARDALAGTRLIAVPMLEPGYEDDYAGRPPLRPICGVGRVIQSHLHPDGRYDILLRGMARVRIFEELPPSLPYRLVRAARLDEPHPEHSLLPALQTLHTLCDRLASALPSGGETLRQLTRQENDAGAACDLVASALLTDPGERQQILETLDVPARLDAVCDAVGALLARITSGRRKGPGDLN